MSEKEDMVKIVVFESPKYEAVVTAAYRRFLYYAKSIASVRTVSIETVSSETPTKVIVNGEYSPKATQEFETILEKFQKELDDYEESLQRGDRFVLYPFCRTFNAALELTPKGYKIPSPDERREDTSPHSEVCVWTTTTKSTGESFIERSINKWGRGDYAPKSKFCTLYIKE